MCRERYQGLGAVGYQLRVSPALTTPLSAPSVTPRTVSGSLLHTQDCGSQKESFPWRRSWGPTPVGRSPRHQGGLCDPQLCPEGTTLCEGRARLVWGQHSPLRHAGVVLSLLGASCRGSFQGIDAQPSLPPRESHAPVTGQCISCDCSSRACCPSETCRLRITPSVPPRTLTVCLCQPVAQRNVSAVPPTSFCFQNVSHPMTLTPRALTWAPRCSIFSRSAGPAMLTGHSFQFMSPVCSWLPGAGGSNTQQCEGPGGR